MKKRNSATILFLLTIMNVYAAVDTRLTLVSNTYDSPSPGRATLIINVESMSTTSDVQINTFQDAFQVDANLKAQILSVNDVTFSNHNFPLASYNTTEDYSLSDGRIRYVYTFNSGTRGTISSSGWTVVVTVMIVYDMIDAQSTINWYSGNPIYFVSDNNDVTLTGSEVSIPSGLTNLPLPVELSSFIAKANGSSVELKWKTMTEINNLGFDIERKSDNSEWKKIGFAEGHGNSNSTKNYSYIDKNLIGGPQFTYRLKQIDNDGKFSYSDEVSVMVVPDKFELFHNYPNPFNPATKIKFAVPFRTKVRLDVYNILGQLIETLIDGELEAGFHEVTFTADDIASGTYIYRLTSDNFSQTEKMLLVK